eukprot:Skav210012  [mRNA]  locus=scaffold1212:50545:53002:- [translate_table: standard]
MCVVATIDCEGWLVSPEDAMNVADEALDLTGAWKPTSFARWQTFDSKEWNIRLGDYSRAISDAEEALEIYQQLDSPQEHSWISRKELQALKLLLQLLLHLAEVREARQRATEAMQRYGASAGTRRASDAPGRASIQLSRTPVGRELLSLKGDKAAQIEVAKLLVEAPVKPRLEAGGAKILRRELR